MSLRYLVARIVRSELACSGREIGQSASNLRKWPVLVTIVGSWPTNSVDELPLTPVTLNLDRRTFVMLLSLGASMMFAPESTSTLRDALVVPFTTEIERLPSRDSGGTSTSRSLGARSGSALSISSEPTSEMNIINIDSAYRTFHTPLRFFPMDTAVGATQY